MGQFLSGQWKLPEGCRLTRSCLIYGVLQSGAHALGITKRCALASSSPTVRCHCRHSDLGRTASSIRPDMIFGKDRWSVRNEPKQFPSRPSIQVLDQRIDGEPVERGHPWRRPKSSTMRRLTRDTSALVLRTPGSPGVATRHREEFPDRPRGHPAAAHRGHALARRASRHRAHQRTRVAALRVRNAS